MVTFGGQFWENKIGLESVSTFNQSMKETQTHRRTCQGVFVLAVTATLLLLQTNKLGETRLQMVREGRLQTRTI